jgi:hypothetical protein
MNLMKLRIELTSDVPVSSKLYKNLMLMQEAVDRDISCLLQNDGNEKSSVDYASRIAVAKKKNMTDICLHVIKKNN